MPSAYRIIDQSSDQSLSGRFTNLDTAPKKYPNAGLRKVTKPTIAADAVDPFENGGLNDEDIISARPTFSRNQDVVGVHIPATGGETLKRDTSRKNEVGIGYF
jgi:hypothetical protein